MKLLILSCNTGQGHNTAGRALLEAALARGVPCEMLDALSFAGPRFSKVVSNTYMKMAVDAPGLFGKLYRAGDLLSSDRRKSPVYWGNAPYAERLERYLSEQEIGAVIAPHLFPAEAMTYLHRRRGVTTPFYAVATDYTCIPFWEETEPTRFFTPHPDLDAEFQAHGIPKERLLATGIPVSARFRASETQLDARRALSIEEDARVFLLMSGSMGFGSVVDMAAELAAHPDPLARLLVLTGRNEDLRRAIDERFAGDARVRALPFTDQVPLYMKACDVLLSKPGGLTSTEAAVMNVALVHTDPIPGCETQNARFFSQRGMSLSASAAEAPRAALRLIADRAAREAMQAAQRQNTYPCAADRILDEVLKG